MTLFYLFFTIILSYFFNKVYPKVRIITIECIFIFLNSCTYINIYFMLENFNFPLF